MGDNDYRDLGVLIGTLFDVRRSNIKFEKVTGMGSVKIGAVFLFLMMMGALFSALDLGAEGKDGSFGGGSGTKEDPYIIESIFDLQAMKDDLSAHYALGGDIDASATRNWNSGAGFVPIGSGSQGFEGSLDGRGHVISGLFVYRQTTSNVGLFGVIDGSGSVKEIGLTSINITGSKNVGGLAGISSGSLSYSYVEGNVNGNFYTGGFVGETIGGKISNCYTTGMVKGTYHAVGGLVGVNKGNVEISFAASRVYGNNSSGGLVGVDFNIHDSIFLSYWDINVSGQDTSDGGIGKTTDQMRSRTTFSNLKWDFTDTWCMIDHVTYPFFRYQDRDPPRANAGPDRVIDEGGTIEFDGSGSSDNLMIINWSWTFTDVENVTLFGIGPVHRFRDPGSFIVTLNVTDLAGNWDLDTMIVTVNDITPPVADAGPDRFVDEGAVVPFDGRGSRDNVGIVNWTWTFTDGGPIVLYGVDPSHRFDDPGVFAVDLKVVDGAGNWHRDVMNVTVLEIPPPFADAGLDQIVDEGGMVTFDGSRSSVSVGEAVFIWNFWDGGVVHLFGFAPKYKFLDPGVFVVTLNLSDGAGRWGTDSMTVTVMDITPPLADAGHDRTVQAGDEVTFNGSRSYDNSLIVNYTWTFYYGHDEVSLYGLSPSFTFDIPGIYAVKLKVMDAAGLIDEDTMVLTVYDTIPPVANAGEDRTVPIGTGISLIGTLSTDNGAIKSYSWTFWHVGERIILVGEEVAFTFNVGGVYEIVLTVTDEFDNSDEDLLTITVIDTGIVKGIVLDENGDPVEGAGAEITASDAGRYDVTTGSDGSFSIEIPHGAFSWRISKEGYRTIIGKGTVSAMDETNLDLTETSMRREDWPVSILFVVLPILLLILLIVGIFIFFFLGKRKADPITENQPPDSVSSIDRAEGE